MFLRLTNPSTVVVCLDGLIDLGDLSKEFRSTLKSTAVLKNVVGVSYRDPRDVKGWLSANPLGLKFDKLVCTPGAWAVPPIAQGLESLDCKSADAVAIAVDALEVAQAHIDGVGAILLTDRPAGSVPHREPFTTGPDFTIHSGESAANIFDRKKLYAGHIAEVLAAKGNVPWLEGVPSGLASAFVFENEEAPESPVQVCGRYFSKSDPRFAFHPLSLRLINGKRYPERQAPLITNILEFWNKLTKHEEALVCCIPARPDEDANLIALAIARLRSKNLKGAANLLRCAQNYPKQKDAGSPEARRENVRGAFEVSASVKRKKVVVVDDITTSFSTLNEARSILMDAGAATVIPMAIAFHPRPLKAGPAAGYPRCTECDSPMVPRFRKADGEPFFACGGQAYQLGEKHALKSFLDVYRAVLAGDGCDS